MYAKKVSTYGSPICSERESCIVRSIRTEPQSLPNDGTIGRHEGSAKQQRSFVVISILPRIGALSDDGDDVPFLELEGFDLEVAERDGLVEVGAVYTLEGAYGLWLLMVIVESVGEGDALAGS